MAGRVVAVRVARPDAACPRCGAFSSRVKEYRTQRVRDGLCFERPTVLVWIKRRFRCATPGCVGSFTESTAQVPPRRRVTVRLCRAIARAAWDRSTAAVARSFRVSWSTAWRAIAAAARREIAEPPTCPPRRLGIDETTFGHHRSFMCGLVDLEVSRLWDLIEGRSKKALVARLEALGEDVRSTDINAGSSVGRHWAEPLAASGQRHGRRQPSHDIKEAGSGRPGCISSA